MTTKLFTILKIIDLAPEPTPVKTVSHLIEGNISVKQMVNVDGGTMEGSPLMTGSSLSVSNL